MKEEGAVLSWFEDTDFSHVKKPNVSNYKGEATASATLSEDYVKDVKDAEPISADYQKYTLQDVYDGEAQNKFNVISTFAGGGGSSTGYRLAGGKILCINEFVEEARNTYHENYPNTPILPDDIKELEGKDLLEAANIGVGKVDILDGSPPCSAFSMAGSVVQGGSLKRIW